MPSDMDLTNRVSALEARGERHGVILETLTRDIELLRHNMATREVVDAAISALASQLSATEDSLSKEMAIQTRELRADYKSLEKRFDDDVTPIKKGVSRLVWLIVTAIVGVLLAIAFNGLPKVP